MPRRRPPPTPAAKALLTAGSTGALEIRAPQPSLLGPPWEAFQTKNTIRLNQKFYTSLWKSSRFFHSHSFMFFPEEA